jgi:hypothetical protein
MLGLLGAVVGFALFAWLLQPMKNGDSASENYDRERHLRDPNGWHFNGPLGKWGKKK